MLLIMRSLLSASFNQVIAVLRDSSGRRSSETYHKEGGNIQGDTSGFGEPPVDIKQQFRFRQAKAELFFMMCHPVYIRLENGMNLRVKCLYASPVTHTSKLSNLLLIL